MSNGSTPSFAFAPSALLEVICAAAVGAAGGRIAAATGQLPVGHLAAMGTVFGAGFALAARGRATSPGSGLIWGLGTGYLIWMVLPAFSSTGIGSHSLLDGTYSDARLRFPQLMASTVLLGAPVGTFVGVWGIFTSREASPFRVSKALFAGGSAGIFAALIFSRWMYLGDFYPLIAGLSLHATHFESVALHFAVACAIGVTFGALFQSDLRNLGSALGWGMAYSMFWWLLGGMTLFPILSGGRVDWSMSRAGEQFGPLVGHILFGLVLGFVYTVVTALWTRLFVDADPLNRKREGPGVRILTSIAWGAAAGVAGGLVTLPLLIRTGALGNLAGLDSALGTPVGIILHLAVSTLIGASYGILFRGETSNPVFGSLWGLLFGLIWWYAGPLTLLPLLRTGVCDWTAEAAATLVPALVGHLAFGLIVANVFMAFERKYTRLLMSNPRYAAMEARQKRPLRTPAPALCVFVLGIGILVPILLA